MIGAPNLSRRKSMSRLIVETDTSLSKASCCEFGKQPDFIFAWIFESRSSIR